MKTNRPTKKQLRRLAHDVGLDILAAGNRRADALDRGESDAPHAEAQRVLCGVLARVRGMT